MLTRARPADRRARPDPTLSFFNYDWSVNALGQAGP